MFSDNFVIAIKVNGAILREVKDLVYLPFGSEYTILVKNLSSKRAKFTIDIDGQDATDGTSLIVNAGQDLELQRFIRNGNLDSGNAFKFIEKTKEIENFRGNKAQDGLITVHYEFEYDYHKLFGSLQGGQVCGGFSGHTYGKGLLGSNSVDMADGGQVYCNNVSFNSTVSDSFQLQNTATASCASNAAPAASNAANVLRSRSVPVNDAGITAPGSEVKQKFQAVYGFTTDGVKHSMTLMLKGEVGQQKVAEAVTVKKLAQCIMCGRKAKQTANFCPNCGSAINII